MLFKMWTLTHLSGSKTCKKNDVWSLTDSTYRNTKVKAYINTIQQMFAITGACMFKVLGLYFLDHREPQKSC